MIQKYTFFLKVQYVPPWESLLQQKIGADQSGN